MRKVIRDGKGVRKKGKEERDNLSESPSSRIHSKALSFCLVF